jgi:hypothetical protein
MRRGLLRMPDGWADRERSDKIGSDTNRKNTSTCCSRSNGLPMIAAGPPSSNAIESIEPAADALTSHTPAYTTQVPTRSCGKHLRARLLRSCVADRPRSARDRRRRRALMAVAGAGL